MKSKLLLFLFIFNICASADARLLAVCGPSIGKAFYVHPEITGWTDDKITGGSFTFLIDEAGKPDIFIRDASKKKFSVRDDGSTLVAPFVDEKSDTFTFILIGNNGGVSTYQLSIARNGSRILLWTDTKNLSAGVISKVSAFTSQCESERK
jgi:hypothetical protein